MTMHPTTPSRWATLLLAATLFIAGCGGGGGGEPSSPPVAVPGAPVIVTQPAATTVDDGASASFSVAASGDATITYQWQRNGSAIAGATGSTLTLAASYADNGARFSAVARNSAGQASSGEALLTVRALLPTITQQPQAATAVAGATQTFSVQLTGGTQPLAYQWQRNGVDIAGATSASTTTPALVAGDDGAQYGVRISNAAGSITSSAATLSIGPAFGQLSISGPGAADVGVGSSYVPTVTPGLLANGPICPSGGSAGACNSAFSLRWSRGPGDQLYVQLLSSDIPVPGAAPGTQINGVSITLSPSSGGYGLQFTCIQPTGCDLATLGMTLDRTARTLSFNNLGVPSIAPGGALIVLNGTLRY